MNIKSALPDLVWNIYYGELSKRIAACECTVETLACGVIQTSLYWDARRASAVVNGKATAKAKNTAYAALLLHLLANGYITQKTFDSAPKIFS